MEKLKGEYLSTRRAQVLPAVTDAQPEWNEAAVAKLRKIVDPAVYKSVK